LKNVKISNRKWSQKWKRVFSYPALIQLLRFLYWKWGDHRGVVGFGLGGEISMVALQIVDNIKISHTQRLEK